MRDGPVSAPGQDAEFRHLFAQEAEQRLSRLGRQLLELEETGSDEMLVASIFRDAHTLKGSAAMVGFDEVARVAHAMEDLLEQLRSGARLATSELVDELLVAVDGLAAMIPAALDGDDRRADADVLERRLRALATTGVRPAHSGGSEEDALIGEPIAAPVPAALDSRAELVVAAPTG